MVPPSELFRHFATFFSFFPNMNSFPQFSAETTAFWEHIWQLLVFRHFRHIEVKKSLKSFSKFYETFSHFF